MFARPAQYNGTASTSCPGEALHLTEGFPHSLADTKQSREMIMFARYVLLLTSLLSFVSALPLAPRDVVDPSITSPTGATVWHVGQTPTVTWSTANLPVNQTNPVGMLVLGYWYNNSENLMLSSPLATNINYATGQVQITVPNVPTRSDYIVVLFGDSGNASPQFTIINDASSPSSLAAASSPPSPGSSSPTPTAPASNTPSASPSSPSETGGSSGGSAPTSVSGTAGVLAPTTSAPSSQATSSARVTVTTTSGTPSSTQSSAAWQKHVPSFWISFGVGMITIYFAFS